MPPLHLLDDDTVEAVLSGRPVVPGLAPLAGAVREIRAATDRPARPSPELAQRMATGDFTGITPEPFGRDTLAGRMRSWLGGASPRVRVVAGAALMFTGLTAATAAGALPDAAQHRVETIIESVSPITFDRDVEPRPDTVVDDADETDVDRPGDVAESEPAGGRPDPSPDQLGRPDAPPTAPGVPPGRPEVPPTKPDTPPDKPEVPPNKPEGPPAKPDVPPDKPEVPPERPDSPGLAGSPGPPSGEDPGNSGNAGSEDRQNQAPAAPPGDAPEHRPAGPKR